jgi:hypothetical protein
MHLPPRWPWDDAHLFHGFSAHKLKCGRYDTALARLAVNFQEVVHSVRTGNADVAKPQ